MENQEYVLQMKGICKSFPGVKALDNAELKLRPGTVHALMGENGAGKSTLMKCLFGIYIKDKGEIIYRGECVQFASAKQALERGVAMVHQELNQVDKRDVMDNLWLGRYPGALGFVSQRAMYDKTKDVLNELEIDINPKELLRNLSVSQRQMIEIAKAVSYGAKVLILDEPTSSLADNEVAHLFRIINKLRKDGCAIVYISHKMDEILTISDEITIMRDGKYISTDYAKDMTMELIIKKMVGRELTQRFPKKDNVMGKNLLEVEALTGMYEPTIKGVSFTLREGEILGVAGLVGSRRTELLECIFGTMTVKSGQMKLRGKRIRNTTPKAAMKNGFALITEERRATGIFKILSIRENTAIASQKSWYINDRKRRDNTEWAIKSMRIKTPAQETAIGTLSGGNQQKVILGRWLLTDPHVLLLDEPTRGIDVGAKYEIYQLIIELAKREKGIMMVSSEMPELLGICDRILVMSNGRLAGEVDTKTATQEEIMRLAALYV